VGISPCAGCRGQRQGQDSGRIKSDRRRALGIGIKWSRHSSRRLTFKGYYNIYYAVKMDIETMEISLNLNSPQDIASGVANRAKQRRLEANLTQLGLASRAQVSLGTLKQFERTGKSSVEFLIAIAFALGAEQEFENLFPPTPRKSIEDVISRPLRVRGRRK